MGIPIKGGLSGKMVIKQRICSVVPSRSQNFQTDQIPSPTQTRSQKPNCKVGTWHIP